MRTLLIMALVIIPVTFIGAFCGYAWSLKTTSANRLTVTMMLETRGNDDRSYTLPVVDSLLTSDILQSHVFDDPKFAPFRDRFDGEAGFAAIARTSIATDAQTKPDANPLVFRMSFDSDDPELSQAALRSYCYALRTYLHDIGRGPGRELERLLATAIEDLHPKITELEKRYREFRRDAPLTFDQDGQAINPHRERQLLLIGRKSELVEDLRLMQIQVAQIEKIANAAKQPSVALNIISQLLGIDLSSSSLRKEPQKQEIDLVEVDTQLVPLMIQRNKIAAEFGENHPTVKQLDNELSIMKQELKRIVKEQTDRILNTRMKDDSGGESNAAEVVASIISAKKVEVDLLSSQVDSVTAQIATEKTSAQKIAKFEQQNLALLREMKRYQQLMDQLEEQMAHVSTDSNTPSINLVQLTEPSAAVFPQSGSPRLTGIGAGIGFAFSFLLSLAIAAVRATKHRATA